MRVTQMNIYVLTLAELIAVASFTVVMPFLPYYVQELGIEKPEQIKLWTGWLFSAQAMTMALVAPVWGSLADKYGRKVMVERAIFGGAVVFIGLALARTVQQALLLRALQGVLTGSVAAATTLVAAIAPRDRSGGSLGILQTGVFLGASLGPMLGGVISDFFGYRAVFWVTSGSLLIAGLLVHILIKETFSSSDENSGGSQRKALSGLAIVLRSPSLIAVLGIRMMARLGHRMVWPMLPLFVAEISLRASAVATVAGIISGLGAFASAGGAFMLGRTSDRIGYRKMLLASTAGLVICYLPQFLVSDAYQLAVLQFISGFLMSGVVTSLAALLATLVPKGHQGAVYGIDTTVVAGANALAPVLAASIAIWWGLRPIFLAATGFFAVGGLIALVFIPDGLMTLAPGGSVSR